VGTRAGADSLEQADAADIKQNADDKISLANLDRNSSAAYGQSIPDVAGGSRTGFSRAEQAQSSDPMRRPLSSLADSQERVLEAFWQDTRAGAPPVPHRGLLESLQSATAALSSEREDIVASQRLAERFARDPAEVSWQQPPVRRQAPAVRPYLVAAAFMILITGGTAVYFLESGVISKRAPDGISRVEAIAPAAEEPLDSLDERDAPAVRSFVPAQPIGGQAVLTGQAGGQAAPASDRAAAENWALAVETLRQLTSAKNAPQQTKAGQPDKPDQLLRQLETWRKTNNAQ
jgi:hypothetical protein